MLWKTFPDILFCSLLAVLAAVALSSVLLEESFAQPQDTWQDAAARTFHRGISESLNVASAFASPGAPNHYMRAMSESVSVTAAFPAQAQQAGPSSSLIRPAQYTPGANQRIDEKSSLTFKNLKHGELDRAQGGTPYVRIEMLVAPPDMQGSFDPEDTGDSAEPDDNSALENRVMLAAGYLLAQKSMDSAALLGAATYGSLLVLAFGVAAKRNMPGKHSWNCLVIVLSRTHAGAVNTSLLVALAVLAATSIAFATDPLMGQAYADSPAGMAYRIGTSGGLGYREWDPSTTSWSSEASLTTAGSQIESVKFLYSPATGSELRVIGVRETNGEIDIYYCTVGCTSAANWNGPNLVVDMGSPTGGRKYFDIAFESSSGDVLIVYDKTTAADTSDFFYQVFDAGTLTLSGESGFDYISDTTADNDIRFFKMASKPGSDEIAMALLDATNSDVVAFIWDGSSFGNTLTVTDTVLSASQTGESFDIAYESSSGSALVVAPGLASSETRYARYTGSWSSVSTLSGGINPDVTTDDQLWMTLKADPNPSSNKIMACATDDVADFSCVQFDAGVPGTAARHEAATGGSARRGDFAWNGWDSTGLALWYDSGASEYQYSTWDGSSSWGTESAAAAAQVFIWVTAVSDNDSTTSGVDSLWAIYSQASPDNIGDAEYDSTTFTLNGVSTISTSAGTANTDDVVSLDSRKPRSYYGSPSDTVSLSDSITAKIAGRGIADSPTVSDSISAVYNNFEPTSDSLALDDSVEAGLFSPGNAFIFDGLAVVDSISIALPRTLSDGVTVEDSASKEAAMSLSDTVAVADDIGSVSARAIVETLTVADSPARALSATRSASDAMTASDSIPSNTNAAGMAYRSNTGSGTGFPKYREWNPDTSAWGSEVEIGDAGSPVRFAWIEFSPVSSKRVVVTLSDDGYLDSFVCDDSCTSASSWDMQNNVAQVRTALSGVERPFDMEYEHTSGNLMLVYDRVSADSAQDLFYRIMPDASNTFGSESSMDDSTASAADTAYSFVRMDSRRTSGSDSIGIIAIDSTNSDAVAFVWDGSAWGNEHELTGTVSDTGSETVGVAYESSSGTLVVAAGEGTAIRYNRFTSSWQTSSTLTGTWAIGTVNWARLVPNPQTSSNEIFLAATGSASDFDSAYWDGSSWTDHTEHDDALGGTAGRGFDFAWSGDSSTGVLVWRTTSDVLDFKRFTAPDAFSTQGTFAETSNHNWVQLATNPETDDYVAALGATVDTTNDIGGIRWNGGETAPDSTGDNAITAGSLDTYEAVQVDFQQATRVSKSASETLTVSDSPAPTQVLARSVLDTVGIADDPRAHIPTPIADSAAVDDSISKAATKSASDSVAITDSLTVQGGGQNSVSASETLPSSDEITRMYVAPRPLSDTLAIADSIAPDIVRPVEDSLAVSDSAEVASAASSSTAGAAYRSNTGTNLLQSPKYREWDPSTESWGSEVELPTTGSNVRDAKLLFSPTSTLRVVVTISADGSLNLFTCDASCTSAGSWTRVGGASFANAGTLGATNPYRPFDIAFEQDSGTLLIVYDKGLTESADFYYRTFDGSTLSSEGSFDYAGSSADSEEIRYFKMASKAGSDEITLVLLDATNTDSYALVWDGSSFGSQLALSTSMIAADFNGESAGVAYETASGASVVFSASGTNGASYARWSGSWSLVQTTDPNTASAGNNVRFARLAGNPAAGSNEVMVCQADDADDLICAVVDSGTLGSWVVHDAGITTVASRAFDFAWDPAGSTGVLVWGTAGSLKSYSVYDGSWGAEQTLSSAGTNRWIVGATSLSAGDVANSLFLALNSADDIGSAKFKFGALTMIGDSTHTARTSGDAYESMSIDFQRSTAVRPFIAETVTLADSVAMAVTRSVTDSLAVIDAAVRSVSISIADSISVAEDVSKDESRAVADSAMLIDAISASITRSMSESLAVLDTVSPTPGRLISESVSVSDAVMGHIGKAISDPLSVSDTITVSGGESVEDLVQVLDSVSMAVTRSLADSAGIEDSVGRAIHVDISETVTVGESVAKVISIGISDALELEESIYQPPDFREGLQVEDSISTGVTRSLADAVSLEEAVEQPARNVPREVAESIAAADEFAEVSVQWSRLFEENLGLADCTPFACNVVLDFDESMSLADAFSPPPEIGDELSITDGVSAFQLTGVQLEEELVTEDAAGFMIELAPPDTPEGVPPLGASLATDSTVTEPLAAESISGTYSMEGWDPDALADQLGLPAIDVSAFAGTGMTLVLPSYHLALEPSGDVPTDDFMMTVKILEVPADMPLLFPIDMASTPGAEEHAQVPWMTMGYTPAVESTNFALVIAPLQEPPAEAQEAEGVPSLYLTIDWVGGFPAGLDPGDPSFYSEAPTFTFAVTEEWADENNAEVDENGVPVIALNLLDESTGEWTAITDVDAPTGAVDGEYVYVAHLEHFSSYAVAAEERTGSGGTSSRDRFSVELADLLVLSDVQRSSAVGIIEEFVGERFSANLLDSVVVSSKPVAYKTLTVSEDVEVLITVQDVTQDTMIPPAAKAVLSIIASNAGDSPESFTLEFWYNDEKGTRAFESSRQIAVGPHESKQSTIEIPFASPGTFDVAVEALSIPEGDILNTTQLTVIVPWLAVYLYSLLALAAAILAGSALALLVYQRKRELVVALVAGLAASVRPLDVRVAEGPVDGIMAGPGLHVGVRAENAKAGVLPESMHVAVVDFDLLNRSGSRQEFILHYEARNEAGVLVQRSLQRVSLAEGQSESRTVNLDLAGPGTYVLYVDVSVQGRVLGKTRIEVIAK